MIALGRLLAFRMLMVVGARTCWPAHYFDAQRREALARGCADTGFVETDRIERMPYGISLCESSWLMRTFERDNRVRLIAFREAATTTTS